MANKFLDENGLLYFWQKIINKFVAKETGKGLSSNDYTTDEKTKLNGIAVGATKTVVTDNLTSTSKLDALSANQGRVLNEKIDAINTNMGDLGGGDMMKSAYDADGDGKVDNADNADKLGGELPSVYAKNSELATVAKSGSYKDLTDTPTDFAPSLHSHKMTDVTGLEDAIDEITAIAEGKCESYTFGTVEELDAALAEYVTFITDGTAMSETNQLNGKILGNGDVFLIRVKEVPDYWWDASTNSKQLLETTKVDLNVISNAEIDTIVATS